MPSSSRRTTVGVGGVLDARRGDGDAGSDPRELEGGRSCDGAGHAGGRERLRTIKGCATWGRAKRRRRWLMSKRGDWGPVGDERQLLFADRVLQCYPAGAVHALVDGAGGERAGGGDGTTTRGFHHLWRSAWRGLIGGGMTLTASKNGCVVIGENDSRPPSSFGSSIPPKKDIPPQ